MKHRLLPTALLRLSKSLINLFTPSSANIASSVVDSLRRQFCIDSWCRGCLPAPPYQSSLPVADRAMRCCCRQYSAVKPRLKRWRHRHQRRLMPGALRRTTMFMQRVQQPASPARDPDIARAEPLHSGRDLTFCRASRSPLSIASGVGRSCVVATAIDCSGYAFGARKFSHGRFQIEHFVW